MNEQLKNRYKEKNILNTYTLEETFRKTLFDIINSFNNLPKTQEKKSLRGKNQNLKIPTVIKKTNMQLSNFNYWNQLLQQTQ